MKDFRPFMIKYVLFIHMVSESTSGYILNLDIFAGEKKNTESYFHAFWSLILIKLPFQAR